MAEEIAQSAPIRPITRGPGFHWFGYYDKDQFDPAGRFVLGMRVDFEHRSPTADDHVRVGMVDLEAGDEWTELGTSNAWCWQQGCMLQWRPGSDSEIVWNDRLEGRLVCHVLDVETHNQRTLGRPIYTISPDGQTALGIDFFRMGRLRPGYGYAGDDPYRGDLAPEDSGIYRLDLETGHFEPIVSIAEIAAIPQAHFPAEDRQHYVNHVLWSPDGSRFIFLHRSVAADGSGEGRRRTRMFTADPDGGNLRIIDDHGGMSHFIWRDPGHILGWANRPPHGGSFYLFDERGEAEPQPVGPGAMATDGHCTYLPGGRWIVNDSYPHTAEQRNQQLYLYHPGEDRRIDLAALPSPPEYTGEWRCDLHPRSSRDGRFLCVDSPHGGDGRQMYLIDVGEVVGRPGSGERNA